jgi:hypothetical protein
MQMRAWAMIFTSVYVLNAREKRGLKIMIQITDFKNLVRTGTITPIVREMKTILSEPMEDLDTDALNGIVGAVMAYTSTELEEVSNMQLTFQEYAVISPALANVQGLLDNPALGAYTKILCILMYRLGQNNAPTSERQSEPPSGA